MSQADYEYVRVINGKLWRLLAAIQINKKQVYLGLYDTELETHQAYIKAIKETSHD